MRKNKLLNLLFVLLISSCSRTPSISSENISYFPHRYNNTSDTIKTVEFMKKEDISVCLKVVSGDKYHFTKDQVYQIYDMLTSDDINYVRYEISENDALFSSLQILIHMKDDKNNYFDHIIIDTDEIYRKTNDGKHVLKAKVDGIYDFFNKSGSWFHEEENPRL